MLFISLIATLSHSLKDFSHTIICGNGNCFVSIAGDKLLILTQIVGTEKCTHLGKIYQSKAIKIAFFHKETSSLTDLLQKCSCINIK